MYGLKHKNGAQPVPCPAGATIPIDADRLGTGPRSCLWPASIYGGPDLLGQHTGHAEACQVVRCGKKLARVAVYGAAVDAGMRTCGPLFHPLCKLTDSCLSVDSTTPRYVV